ncbi:MAG TPA: vitamin K epoxide reductase family protein [Candidatus Nanoarchaeia archaeon]|nr:vitamin K epoxide reductase family protein [Candidatus Nanoarchaeia archaeon]
MQKKYFIIILIVLSIIGLGTSFYLVYNHYYPNLQGSVCDITAAISCAVVNSGIYSTILGIPVALFGVLWFLILGVFSWKVLKGRTFSKQLLGWNVIGMFFVIYFIYIEILLTTICPLCTVVHVLVLFSLILSLLLYKKL